MKYLVEYFNGQVSEIKEIEADKYTLRSKFIEFINKKSTVFLVALDAVVSIEIAKNDKQIAIKVSNDKIIRKLKLRKLDGTSKSLE